VFTPRITETPLFVARTEHDDFADEPAQTMPNREPYQRASQREMVRESLSVHLHTHAYDQEG
jgi:hypothetical protein